MLDDASYNGDAAATAGTVLFASPNLTWTGNLAVGAMATITFSVTVSNPDTGNKILASTLASATPGSTCPAGNPAAGCTAAVDVAVLTIVNSAGASSTTPGSVVRFTVTFTNSGQVPYTGITVVSNITDVVDDATPNGDQTATPGTLSLTATGISWTGNIPIGGTVTITGTVTVNNGLSVPVIAGALSVTAPISADLGTTAPGGSTSASLGTIQVTDNRGFGANWTATVSATGFTTGNGAAPQTIPASDAYYDITGLGSTTGSATFSTAPETNLSGDPQPVVSATNVGAATSATSATSATWDPLIDVHVPAAAVVGQYTATIVHSVS